MRSKEYLFIAIFLAVFIVIAISYLLPTKTTFAGSHTIYESKNSSYGPAEFCSKCHPEVVGNLSSSTAHNIAVTSCICHGYNPNANDLMRNINLTHNLTKNVYCTNCHTRYNESTGDIIIYGDGNPVNVTNQSGHYIFFNSSNATLMGEIYNRSWRYFNRSFGPLS